MKKKIWIEVNHDGPIMYDEHSKELFLDDIEKELKKYGGNINIQCEIGGIEISIESWVKVKQRICSR